MPTKFKNTTGDLNVRNPRKAWMYPSSELLLAPGILVKPGELVDVTALLKEEKASEQISYFVRIGIGELVETRGVSSSRDTEKKQPDTESTATTAKKSSRSKRSRKKT